MDRAAIVTSALEIADAEGLEAVSFRRLATELGVTPMALYRHVRDKTDLMDAMADVVLAPVQVPEPPRPRDWVAELRVLVQSASRALDAHPAGAALMVAGSGSAPNALRLAEAVVGIVRRAGFTPAEAMAVVQQLTTVVVGPRILYGAGGTGGTGGSAHESGGAWGDTAEMREFGLNLFLAGLESMSARKKGTERSTERPPVQAPRRALR